MNKLLTNSRAILKKLIKVYLRDISWQIRGSWIRNPPIPKNPETVLFICMGNIVRSVFAEQLARNMAIENEVNLNFLSAGVQAKPGTPSPYNAIICAKDYDIDLTAHRSKAVDKKMINSNDIIIVMEIWHKDALIEKFPHSKQKIFFLSLFEDESQMPKGFFKFNIPDPYGHSQDKFIRVYKRISRCLNGFFAQIE